MLLRLSTGQPRVVRRNCRVWPCPVSNGGKIMKRPAYFGILLDDNNEEWEVIHDLITLETKKRKVGDTKWTTIQK